MAIKCLIELFIISLAQVHGSVGEPWWLWVEDPINDHIYHSEYFLLQKKQVQFFLLTSVDMMPLKDYMMTDVCTCSVFMNLLYVFLPLGGNRRASAHSVYHPHLRAPVVPVLHQGGVRSLARSRGRLHN